MRIISGTHRGRNFHPPKGIPVRPTTDLAKESLFNILVNRVDFEELHVLDLFAGTGSITYEFASRGAGHIVAVEINHKCAEFIQKTAEEFRFSNINAVKANVFNYLKAVKRQFDVVFADPPYSMTEVKSLPGLIFSQQLLNTQGWLIIEHDASVSFTEHPQFVEERRYGKVHFSFFQP